MKAIKQTLGALNIIVLPIFLILMPAYGSAQILDKDRSDLIKPEVEIPADIYWHIKAYRPEAKLLNIKAIDREGNYHDVKAIQRSYETNILNVKALVNGKQLPIKLIVKENDRYYPLKAIDDDGTLIDIKAVTGEGEILPVKGVSRSGNIIHIRAIAKDDKFYNVIAISPDGTVNSVKGLKMLDTAVEAVINGVSIFAHVKSISQY